MTYDGIVIARRETGESGAYVDILTDERGVIEAAAHGAKKLNSTILSSTALFSYAKFSLSEGRDKYTINSAKPKFSFHALGNDIEKLALASYFAQSVRYCTPSHKAELPHSESPDSAVRFLAVSLYEAMNGRSLLSVKAAFELRYSAILGFAPNLAFCDNCGGYECENGMYFLPSKGRLICADCFNSEYEGVYKKLSPEVLFVMRGIVFSPLERAFKFTLDRENEKKLSEVCEDFFLHRTERSFPALDYFKALM